MCNGSNKNSLDYRINKSKVLVKESVFFNQSAWFVKNTHTYNYVCMQKNNTPLWQIYNRSVLLILPQGLVRVFELPDV